MAIDWRKAGKSWLRCYWWWMRVGLIAVPFGVLWGCATLYLGYESKAVLIVLLAVALFTIYKIQGMPPTE
jgi:hypothetical protein